jgi:leucyl/phenylalanyl-tRNA--protein transferase
MPIFLLGEEPVFPPAQLAGQEGIIAAGGDLSPQRLLNAYASGIFPWYSEGEPILWWSPDPRLVLLPGQLHISKSMKKIIKKPVYRLALDTRFEEVIEQCSAPRDGQTGTWITAEMKDAYLDLHDMGFAHSMEVWQNKQLVGGLYGVSLGRCFFGESMFSLRPNASKLAFIHLAHILFQKKFVMIDCQLPTEHMKRMGAEEIPRADFLVKLQKGLEYETIPGKWRDWTPGSFIV